MNLFSRDFWWPAGAGPSPFSTPEIERPAVEAPQESGESRSAARLENPAYSVTGGGILGAIGSDADGQLVTPITAMGTSAIYACVAKIADTRASLPWNLMEREPGTGRVRQATERPLFDVLRTRPNGYQTAFVFGQQGQAQALLWGNFYAEIQRDVRTGECIGLWPIPAWMVTPSLSNGVKVFDVNGMRFRDEDILHIPALGWDGVRGISPIALHRRSIGLSLSAEAFGEGFYRNGTRLAGVLEHPQQLSLDAMGRLRTSWADAYSGAANAGKVAILEEGMKFSAFTMPLEDAQFVETRTFQISDAARIYGVPLHKLGVMDGAKYNNVEQGKIEFQTDTMLPWLERWEQEANTKLLTAVERRTMFTRFRTKGQLRGDLKSRFESYALARQWGWMSVNDIRDEEDENGIGEAGDIYLSPMNMTPAGQVNAPTQEPHDGE